MKTARQLTTHMSQVLRECIDEEVAEQDVTLTDWCRAQMFRGLSPDRQERVRQETRREMDTRDALSDILSNTDLPMSQAEIAVALESEYDRELSEIHLRRVLDRLVRDGDAARVVIDEVYCWGRVAPVLASE